MQLGQCPGRTGIDAISDDDFSAFLAQPSRCCPSNSLTCAGHNTHLVRKPASASRPGVQLDCHKSLL
jgi:hypothetical protein